jgi:transcriptional regulator with XRE-family HTH domain
VDSSGPERVEDFAQLLTRLKDTYNNVSDSEIARRIGVSPATVNAWVHRKRGGTRGPARETLQALAREFPKFTEAEIFAAVGRKTPGPLSPDAEERVQELFRELTAEQQETVETQIRALADKNRSEQ